LRGEDDLRAAAGHRPAADLLRDRAAVGVGGVDEVAARVEVAIDDRPRFLLVAAPLGHAEGHGAEAELGDAEAGTAESPDAHGGGGDTAPSGGPTPPGLPFPPRGRAR